MPRNTPASPTAEVAEHRALRWQVLGQESPGDATPQNVEDALQDLPPRPQRRPPTRSWFGQQGRNNGPLPIGQIRFVSQAGAALLPPGVRGPHGASRKASAPSWNHPDPGHSTPRTRAPSLTGRTLRTTWSVRTVFDVFRANLDADVPGIAIAHGGRGKVRPWFGLEETGRDRSGD